MREHLLLDHLHDLVNGHQVVAPILQVFRNELSMVCVCVCSCVCLSLSLLSSLSSLCLSRLASILPSNTPFPTKNTRKRDKQRERERTLQCVQLIRQYLRGVCRRVVSPIRDSESEIHCFCGAKGVERGADNQPERCTQEEEGNKAQAQQRETQNRKNQNQRCRLLDVRKFSDHKHRKDGDAPAWLGKGLDCEAGTTKRWTPSSLRKRSLFSLSPSLSLSLGVFCVVSACR